jgi:ribosomal protein S12 methylthiotransferase accessory factor
MEKMGELLKAGDYIDTDAFSSLSDIFVDDPSLYPDVDIEEVMMKFEPVKHLVRKFKDAGIPLLIKDITQKDIQIPTLAASSIEWITHDYALLAKGFGTHPDSRIALTRAITEVSQTRAANIQGARDNLKRIHYREKDAIHSRKWPFMQSYLMGQNRDHNMINFSEISTSENKDILEDIDFILSALKRAGIRRAIIVNLTNPDIEIPVVRVIIPGLETFEVTHSIMGKRAKMCFNAFLKS